MNILAFLKLISTALSKPGRTGIEDAGYGFDAGSQAELYTCHPLLREIARRALLLHDFAVVKGHRPEAEQRRAFKRKRSKLDWPDGKHNGEPSLAFDLHPIVKGRKLATSSKKFDATRQAQFAYFLGIVYAIAREVTAGTAWDVRLGVNWNMDAEILSDQTFQDWFHVELVKRKTP